MTNVIVTSAAEIDFTESLCWYAEHSIEAANDFDAAFDRALHQIATNPERYPSCDERHRYFLMRRFPFRIIYRLIRREVFIMAVAHASREPGYWRDR